MSKLQSYIVQGGCWFFSVIVAALPIALIAKFAQLQRMPDPDMFVIIVGMLAFSFAWATLPYWWKS